MSLKYKRLLIKISGEQLAGDQHCGVDTKLMAWLAHEVRAATNEGAQIVLFVGGGNYARGNQLAGGGIQLTTAHYAAMLATVMNALVLGDVMGANDVPTRVLANLVHQQVADTYTHRRAIHHLEQGRVVIVGGGIGRPYFTTDTGAVNLALELDCDIICKATKVDGVYDRDPAKFADAVKSDHISFQQALADNAIGVMDKAALGLAMEQRRPILVFDLATEGNIRRAALGELVGTIIS
jgi:uridylate kinase